MYICVHHLVYNIERSDPKRRLPKRGPIWLRLAVVEGGALSVSAAAQHQMDGAAGVQYTVSNMVCPKKGIIRDSLVRCSSRSGIVVVVRVNPNHPFIAPPRLHCRHYCNTIAQLLRNIRPPPPTTPLL